MCVLYVVNSSINSGVNSGVKSGLAGLQAGHQDYMSLAFKWRGLTCGA